MKTIFLSLVAFLIAFIIGCQESSITDPVVTDQSINSNNVLEAPIAYKTITSTWPGYIRLHQSVYDPSHPMFNNVLINGMVKYKLDVNKANISPLHKYIKLELYVDAEIRHNCPRQKCTPSITAFADEIIRMDLFTDQIYYVEKKFVVRNNCCSPVQLILKFAVQRDNVTLESATLRPSGGWQTITTGY